MGSPEEFIYGRLRNTVAVTTLCNTKIYPDFIPENVRLPAICFSQVSDPREHAMCADPNIGSPRYQVDVFSTSWSQMRTLANAVKNALRDYQGTTWCNIQRVFFEGSIPMTELDPQTNQVIRRASQDYVIWWST